MVKTTSASLIFLLTDRDLPLLFGKDVWILYTPAEVDIHPRIPLEGKIKKYKAVKRTVVFTIFSCHRYDIFGCLYDFGFSNSIFSCHPLDKCVFFNYT